MSSETATGSSHLEGLTDTQRLAALWEEGPFLLLAGPGSGKTRVLTTRIARLLGEARGASFRVLALTFTTRAADEMRERIARLVPDLERRLFVGTIHAFCADVLRQHGPEVGLATDFRIYSLKEDREHLLREAFKKKFGRMDSGLPETSKVLPLLDRIRDQLLEPDEVAAAYRDQEVGKKVAKAYAAYDEYLSEARAQDFGALLLNTYRIFKRFPAIAKRYRAVYRFWNVDEFQDTNLAQYKLLSTLAGDDFKNIFIVADDDQIIYQWNGASFERLEEFVRDFSPEVLQLPTNFRCPAEIVEAANRLVSFNQRRTKGKAPLIAARDKEKPGGEPAIRVMHFKTDDMEAAGVAKDISERWSAGEVEIAVLARTRKVLEKMESALQVLGLPSRIIQRRDRFQTPSFIWLHACLKQSDARTDARNLEYVVGAFNELVRANIGVEDVISGAAAGEGDLLRTWVRVVLENKLSKEASRGAEMVSKWLVQSTDYRSFVADALAWLEEVQDTEDVSEGSPFLEDKRAWRGLDTEISRCRGRTASLEVFLQELELRSKEPPAAAREIALMTIHGAKGNEFDYVYLSGLAEDILPSYQSKKGGASAPAMEEERRNCFVAITRTKRHLVLSYADEYSGWTKAPSRFLSDMGLSSK